LLAQSNRAIFQIVKAVSRGSGDACANTRGISFALAEEISAEAVGPLLRPRNAAQSRAALEPGALRQHSVEFGVLSRLLNVFPDDHVHVYAWRFSEWLLRRDDGCARDPRARNGRRDERAVSDSARVHGR